MSVSTGGTRVRLVCTSCKTLCEVFIPSPKPSPTPTPKAVRYQVRCPNCKAINEPQNLNAAKFDPKRKVSFTRTFSPAPRRLHQGARRTCAGSAACSTCSKAAKCFGVSSGAEETGPSKLRRRTARPVLLVQYGSQQFGRCPSSGGGQTCRSKARRSEAQVVAERSPRRILPREGAVHGGEDPRTEGKEGKARVPH